jgi:hypothetical protein
LLVRLQQLHQRRRKAGLHWWPGQRDGGVSQGQGTVRLQQLQQPRGGCGVKGDVSNFGRDAVRRLDQDTLALVTSLQQTQQTILRLEPTGRRQVTHARQHT